MAELKGSCRCGKVQYTVNADPIFTGICHCTSCRKSTGSAYATVVGVPTPALDGHRRHDIVRRCG